MLRELKYLLPYIIPAGTFAGIYRGGWWSYEVIVVAFVVIPILELILPRDERNISESREKELLGNRLYDYFLYLMVPVQYAILGYLLHRVSTDALAPYEIIGMTLSMGVQCGAIGINVAHELGHRQSRFERFLAKALLLSSLYMHFIVEHNRGHHKHVATPADPATARLGEPVYLFWLRSITGSFRSAWNIERRRLSRLDRPVWSLRNDMMIYLLVEAALVVLVYVLFGWLPLLVFLGAALMGILLLETVNYIEHYGLQRRETAPGRYERVQPWHSWNSDHTLGRIMLFELTRHSDHHYKASRKYQILRHLPQCPQLPTGYPGAMMLSLLPPLWFRMVDPLVKQQSERLASQP